MRKAQLPATPRPPSAWTSLRRAVTSLFEALGPFLVASLLVMGAVALTLLTPMFGPALLLVIVAVPAMCGVTRMAVHAVNDDRVRISQLVAGARWRFLPHLGLGVAQLVIILVSLVNIRVGAGTAGILGAASAVVSGYVALTAWTVAVAAWPLLLDPRHPQRPVMASLRLAVTVVLAHPARFAGIAVALAVLVAVTLQTLVAAPVVPALVGLIAAHAAVPAADAIAAS